MVVKSKLVHENKNPDPYDGINSIISGFNFIGLWSKHKHSSWLYKLYGFCIFITFVGMFEMALLINFFTIDNVEKSTEILSTSITELALLMKLLIVIYQRENILNLIKFMRNVLKVDSPDNFNEITKIYSGINQSKKLYKILFIAYFTSAILAGTAALLTKDNTLPIASWYPIDWRNSNRMYWISWSYQLSCMFIHVPILAGIDAMPSSFMCICSGYYDGLSSNLSRFGTFGMATNREDVLLRKSLEKTINLKRSLIKIERVFSLILLIQFGVSGFVICTTTFQISLMSITKQLHKYCFMIIYLTSMSASIFMPCYFGNEILLKNFQILRSLYDSNWTILNLKLKRKIIIFMEGIKRDNKIRAGMIFDANLTTFTSIANFSFSLYALLRNLKG